jgi:membrane fusion protein, multidrug efflux system
MHGRYRRSLIPLAILLFALLLTAIACSKSKDAAKLNASIPPPTVIVEQIDQKTVPIYSEYVGQTKADDTVELRARVEGILEKVYFKEGSAVRKGELLFSIDKRPYLASQQSAKAALAKAESDLAQAQQRTDVIQAQAALVDAEATYSKTQQDLARIRPLAAQKAVTEIELDAAVAADKSAKATVDAKQANLTNITASVTFTIQRAAAEVSAAKARLTQTDLDLSYCDIYSPINGIIGFQQVDVGNLVGRNDATLLATVSLSNPVLVDFSLSEVEYLKLVNRENPGKNSGNARFQLILSDDSIHPGEGTFKVLDRTVDPTTGTMKAQASFPNPGSYLRPGQFARVRVAVSEVDNAILVPEKAIQELQGAKTVMVVDAQNKVQIRTLRLGDKADNYYIVLDGLQAGERVIVEGMQKARPGSEVRPQNEAVASDSGSKKEGS